MSSHGACGSLTPLGERTRVNRTIVHENHHVHGNHTESVMEGGEKSYCKERLSKHEHNGNTTDGSYRYSGIYLYQRCGNFCVPHPLVTGLA